MKKFCVIVVLCLMLVGCGTAETFETLGQVQHESNEVPAMATVQLQLPQTASAEVFSSGGDTMYDCDGYTLMLQTVEAGDFSRTVQNLSGFSAERLTIMESKLGTSKRYEWVWTAAGEGGEVLCKAMVLDDGNYHYCLCAMAPAIQFGKIQEQLEQVFQSFNLT